MLRTCEFCGGQIRELARTQKYLWIGCRHCHRSWREDIEAGSAADADSAIITREVSFLDSAVGKYTTATAAVALAFGLRLALKPFIGYASPFLLFTPAVLVAAWYGGIGPAVLATAAGAVLGNYFFIRTMGGAGVEQWDRLALFLLVGGLIASLATVLRISRHRLADGLWREQKARAEAEAANQAKDDFLTLVSHELQTPVSVVQGWSATIRKRQLHGDALHVALDAIERNAQIQSRLVQDILDRSRIASGQLRLEPEIVSVSEIVRAAVEQVRPSLDRHHVELTTAIRDAEYRISGDPVRLQQVFTNLLSNAAKFTSPGGHINVEVSSTPRTAVVTIRDDGAGISPEFLPHVFDGFQQDPRTLAASSRGLGLGLSIARHFVERHGGTIRAASDGPGKGASFTVELPLQPRHPAVDEGRPAQASGALHSIAVLLVDDDEDARLLLTQTLEYYGAYVWAVGSASEAVRMLESRHADVLLSDLRMPGEDGFTLIHRLRSRSDPHLASIPAASITASRQSEDRFHAIAAGYQVHLHKPIDPDELVTAVLALAAMPRDGYERMH